MVSGDHRAMRPEVPNHPRGGWAGTLTSQTPMPWVCGKNDPPSTHPMSGRANQWAALELGLDQQVPAHGGVEEQSERVDRRAVIRAQVSAGRSRQNASLGDSPTSCVITPLGGHTRWDARRAVRTSAQARTRACASEHRRRQRGDRAGSAGRHPAFGLTQFGNSAASVASGSEPWPITASWNALRSKRASSRASSSRRSRRISRIPSM